jgi:hypothetical protein
MSTLQREIAVFTQASCDLRLGKCEVRQRENLVIPECMTLVPFTGQALGGNTQSGVMRGSHDLQMILSESNRQLIKVVFCFYCNRDIFPDKLIPFGAAFFK